MLHVGDEFGKLTVKAAALTRKQSRMWVCACACGRITEVSTRALRSGQTAHCGCSPRRKSAAQRFWGKVEFTSPTGCWLWSAARSAGGYGVFRGAVGKNVVAHRFSFEMLVGPVPPGLDLDHLCRNRACVNPRHLEPVTRSENLRRAARPVPRDLKPACKRGHTYTDGSFVLRRVNGGVSRRCLLCRRVSRG